MNLHVSQTAIHHASDIVYWLDASTGKTGSLTEMQRINYMLSVTLTEVPQDLRYLHKVGAMVLWRYGTTLEVYDLSSEIERTRPVASNYTLAGVVSDIRGNYNPRSFSLIVGAGEGKSVELYPSPKGTRIGMGGGIVGNIRFANSGEPGAWAMVNLQVEIAPSTDLVFVAQADANGDFRLSMSRLPPLPENEDDYSAKLSIKAKTTASGNIPMEPSGQDVMVIESQNEVGTFEDEIELKVKPGEILNIKSFERAFLAVRPTD